MIEVSVKLISAIHPSRNKELARMHICNIGGTDERGDYEVRTYRGRDKEALDKRIVTRKGHVADYPRLAIHVWHLIFEALKATNYNRRPKKGATDESSSM